MWLFVLNEKKFEQKLTKLTKVKKISTSIGLREL